MTYACPVDNTELEDVGNYLDTEEDIRYDLYVCPKCGYEHRSYR